MSLSENDIGILNELERRELINTIVEFTLSQLYQFTDNKFHKVKRGEVHNRIAKEIGVTLNNTLCSIVKDIIEENGGVSRTISGTQYYLHLRARS